MGKLFKDLKAGFEDAIAHEKGKLHLRSNIIEIPEPPYDYEAKDIFVSTQLLDQGKE